MLAVKEKIVARRKPHKNISLSMRNLILEEITEKVCKQTPKINQLASRVREKLTITPLEKKESFVRVMGVDAGSQIIPLASMQYAIIGALAYLSPLGKRFFLTPESVSKPYGSNINFKRQVDIRRESRLFETAYRFLEERPDTELVLIDGPLALSNWWQRAGEEKDRQRLIDSVNRFLRYCMEEQVVVAGIVKRPSARYLLQYLGLRGETDLTDSFLMLQILAMGEMTEVFSPRMSAHMRATSTPVMDAVDAPIYSAYLRLSKEWQIPPIRVDVPGFCLNRLTEVANYCYSTCYWNGVPHPIVKADEGVKVTKGFISDVYSEVLGRINRTSGDLTQVAPFWGESQWMGV